MSIIELLVILLVFAAIFWIINIVPAIPPFVRQVLTVVFGVLLIIMVLQGVGLIGSVRTPMLK